MLKNQYMVYLIKYRFCGSTEKPRPIYHPYYLSPHYQQLEYSPYYFNKAMHLQMTDINTKQISEKMLPQFLSQQIKTDKTLFIKNKEIIFVGRSNVGKSSIINSIFQNRKIARVSKTPGTTQFLHFHQASLKADKILITDAPGLGFANINKAKRSMWAGLIDQYLKISSRLCLIFMCINFEHGVKPADIDILKQINKYNVNIQLLLTKTDKINEKNYLDQLKSINQEVRRLDLKKVNDRIIGCSSKTRFGIDIIKCRIVEALQHDRMRNINENQDLLLEYLKDLRIQGKQIQKPQKTFTKPYLVRKLIYNSKLTKFLI